MNLTTALRPSYQLPMFNAIRLALRDYKHVIVQSPAGSGKSVIMSHLVYQIVQAYALGRVPLVLTHRAAIQSQLLVHCNGVSIDSDTDHVFIQPGHCYVAMHQTLIKRTAIIQQLAALGDRLLIITDECHYGIFNKMFDILPNAYRLGFSATPAWKWAKHLPVYYKYMVAGPQITTLMEEGSLVPFDYYEMKTNLSGLVATNKDYTEESQYNVFERNGLFDGLVSELRNFTGHYKKGVIFCSSIKQADSVHLQLTEHGFNPTKCHSKIKNNIYERFQFERGADSNLMVSVSSLAEGWDFPTLDLEILYRATTSLPLYIQMGMRGSRPSSSKSKCITLDFGGNNTRFGGSSTLCSMTMDRDWNELWQPPKKVQKNSSPGSIKICPLCEYMLSASVRSCCNCGYIYPENEVLLKQGELVKIEQELAAQKAAITGRRISDLSAQELANYAILNNKKPFAMRVAKSRAITNNQFIVDYGRAIGYKESWATRELRVLAEEKRLWLENPKNITDFTIPYFDMIIK